MLQEQLLVVPFARSSLTPNRREKSVLAPEVKGEEEEVGLLTLSFLPKEYLQLVEVGVVQQTDRLVPNKNKFVFLTQKKTVRTLLLRSSAVF